MGGVLGGVVGSYSLIMELSFDIRGNLKPYERTELTLQEFKNTFVDSFEADSTRYKIFDNYKRFLEDFSKQISNQFTHWINGSFVTVKRNPRDIDFVTLIEDPVFKEYEVLIDKKFRLLGAKQNYKVDAYTIRKYPSNHERYRIYESELVYWDSWFSWTKKNRAKKKFRKGYIEIKFENY